MIAWRLIENRYEPKKSHDERAARRPARGAVEGGARARARVGAHTPGGTRRVGRGVAGPGRRVLRCIGWVRYLKRSAGAAGGTFRTCRARPSAVLPPSLLHPGADRKNGK